MSDFRPCDRCQSLYDCFGAKKCAAPLVPALGSAFEKAPMEKWVWYYWAHFIADPPGKWHRTYLEGSTKEEAEALEDILANKLSGTNPRILVREFTTYTQNTQL